MWIISDPTWESTAIEAIALKIEDSKRHNWRLQSGKVFFKHRRAKYHLDESKNIVRKMVLAMQPMKLSIHNCPTNSTYSGPLSEQLFFHLDSFLEATRSSYDAVLSFLVSAEVVRGDSPLSINGFVNRIRTIPNRAKTDPADVAELIERFWSDTGELAKDYRDCFTHHVTLSGPTWVTAVMMKGSNLGWEPHLPWPDNPDAKKHSNFTFDKNLDAITYCNEVHQSSDIFLRKLVDRCLAKWQAERNWNEYPLQSLTIDIK